MLCYAVTYSPNSILVCFIQETLAKCCRSKERGYDQKRAYRVLSRSQRKRIGIHDSTDYSGELKVGFNPLVVATVFCKTIHNDFSCFVYLGSSVRDESLYSTITQKQSFDSVTLPRVHSLSINQTAANCQLDSATVNKSAHESNNISMTAACRNNSHVVNRAISNLQATDSNYHALRNVEANINGTHDDLNTMDSTPEDAINVMYNRMGEIAFVGTNVKSKSRSRFVKFFENLFNWRRQSRNIGYYSPPLGQNVDECKGGYRVEQDYGFDEQLDTTSMDDGAISNSSLKDVDKFALEDELSAYMKELRMREKR